MHALRSSLFLAARLAQAGAAASCLYAFAEGFPLLLALLFGKV